VKPVQFRYVAPETVEDAVRPLAAAGLGGKALAGGQSLVPMMNFRLARPEVLVDLNRIRNLAGIQVDRERIRIGAMTRHQTICESEELRAAFPLLPEAAGHIGHWAIRNRGTIGGSVAHADPAAEWPAVLKAVGARLIIQGPHGSRTTTVDDLVAGPLSTTLAPDELIVAVEIDRPPAAVRWGCYEVARRPGDFALVGAVVRVEGDRATWTWFGLGGPPVSRSLDHVQDGRARAEGLKIMVGELEAVSDLQATAEWRRRVAVTVAERAFQQAEAARKGDAR
jgi:CO/xanthine dehydrogenase FAD-binding subunit